MADSTLHIAYDEIAVEIADFLGLGRTSSDWSTDDTARIAAYIKDGLHQFYFPPKIEERQPPHKWSFLTPTTYLTTAATYSTGTVTIASGVVTLADGTFPAWAESHGTLVIDNTEYTIDIRDGDTQITLDDTTLDADAGTSYELKRSNAYDLPDDFGSIVGNKLSFNDDFTGPGVILTGEPQIRALMQGTQWEAKPSKAAIRPKTCDGTEGQKWEILFHPTPDDAYTLYYRMRILPDAITSGAGYMYGGAFHRSTILASCLAIADLRMNERKGEQWDQFMQRLTASIESDQEVGRTRFFGYNGDMEDRDINNRPGMYDMYLDNVDVDSL